MQISQDVLAVLSEVAYPNPTQVQLVGQLDRNLYTKVNKVLEALGGTWNRKAKAHVFGSDARVRIDHAITVGEVETGQDVGWFPTPPKLARDLVALADVRDGHLVLEPSAGEGAIVKAVLDSTRTAEVYAIEYNAGRQDVLRKQFGPGDVLTEHGRVLVSGIADFLDFRSGKDGLVPRFDRVVMNPPFCRVGKGDHLDHVRHAYSLLKPGGVLVSVMPSSVEFRRDGRYREFREWALDSGTITPLPAGSFKASGTGVSTCVVRMER